MGHQRLNGGRFGGKVAVITGGATGIGLATARAFVESGAHVLIVGDDEAAGQQALAALALGPGCAAFAPADVRDAAAVAAALAQADRNFGGLDIVFNNAGVLAPGRVDQLSEAEWDRCLDTNLKGAYLVSRAALQRLRARGGGVIINNASNAGLRPRPEDPAYVASKAGLIALTQSMALAHAAERIRVNALCPGPVARTQMTDGYLAVHGAAGEARLIEAAPLAAAWGRLIAPEEVAAAVLFLCSDEAQMITGAVLAVDGGKSAGLPGM